MNSNAPEICILLAAERSGTHFFQSMVTQMPGVFSTDEVCNPKNNDIRKSRWSYLRYKASAPLSDEKFVYPDYGVQVELLDAYLAFVRATSPAKTHIILDIKYPHVHNFNPAWWAVLGRPFLLEYAAAKRIRLVHLVRRKPYRTVISNLYGELSGVWHVRDGEKPPVQKMTVDRTKLEARTVQLAKTIRMFDGWLDGCRSVTISYEDLSERTEVCLAGIRDFLKLKGDIPQHSRFVKSTPSYEDVIANYAEIAHWIDVDLADIAVA